MATDKQKLKTDELTGAALHLAVHLSAGTPDVLEALGSDGSLADLQSIALNADDIQFPVDASMLLKIIQQERIMACLDTNPRGTPDCAKEWWADVGGWMSHDYVAGDIAAATGPDHATAVMRAYVKLKMGNEVML